MREKERERRESNFLDVKKAKKGVSRSRMDPSESLAPLPQPGSSDQQQIASASILLQIVMLGLAFVSGHVLRRHKIYYINEASASLLIG